MPSSRINCYAPHRRNLAILPRELVVALPSIRRVSNTHARGSAMEAAAALDTMRVMKLVSETSYTRGIELLEGIVAMLTKMT